MAHLILAQIQVDGYIGGQRFRQLDQILADAVDCHCHILVVLGDVEQLANTAIGTLRVNLTDPVQRFRYGRSFKNLRRRAVKLRPVLDEVVYLQQPQSRLGAGDARSRYVQQPQIGELGEKAARKVDAAVD